MLVAPAPGRPEVTGAAQAPRSKPKDLSDGFSSVPTVEFSPLACGLIAAPRVPHGGKARGRRAGAPRGDPSNSDDSNMRLYQDAEAVRLKTPPGTQRLLAGTAEGTAHSPLHGGLQIAPEAAESPLFLGLYSDPNASPSCSQRSGRPKCSPSTPTTACVSRSPASGGEGGLYEPEPEQSSTDP
ncbi:unnamed protein product [Prorocentrum cordatum]|uniref:Uncharacterized protein n=1 Tax=Prorocentrum cordatum TaxID=2364126 RepID=A0ABN9R7T5_9DINO|nr:unnamed protein product [Polarella glacialis]